ncbi:MAG: hypothetical protein V1811_01730 [Candidatus Micrarchaeota archaeon]
MEVGYDALRKVLLQERHYPALSALDEGFFDQYSAFVKAQEIRLKESFSLDAVKEFENTIKALDGLKETRLQKILFKALRDLQNDSVNSEGLAREEKELYRTLVKTLMEYSRGTHLTSPEAQEVRPEPSVMTVRILNDVKEFIGADASQYGPFSIGQTVQLKKDVASFLVRKKRLLRFNKTGGFENDGSERKKHVLP